MDKRYFVKLTQAVYRTTDQFPEEEPLKIKIRDKANEILTDLVLNDPNTKEQTLKAIEVLESYFEVASFQNWVNPLNFIILEQEYDKIRGELKQNNNELINKAKIKDQTKKSDNLALTIRENQQSIVQEVGFQAPAKVAEKSSKHSERHQKILEFLKEKGQAQVWEIKQALPNVSKRTIRRDFEYLVDQNLVERMGERNNTFYKVI